MAHSSPLSVTLPALAEDDRHGGIDQYDAAPSEVINEMGCDV